MIVRTMRRVSCLLVLLAVQCPALLRAADVSFADIITGRAAIVDDPAYFDRLQPMEMETKTGRPLEATTLAGQRAECRRRYQLAVQEFSGDEQTAIRAATAAIDRAVRKDYPRYADTPWSFLKVAGHIEGGFPHTRGKHIVLAESVCRWIVSESHTSRVAPVNVMELLLHEQMHVFQRANSDLFDSLYTGQWGLIRAKSIKTCPWIVEHQMVNPDAIDCPWVFPIRRPEGTRYIWPLCSLSDGPGPKQMAADFSMFAFYLVPDGDGYRVEQSGDGRPVYSELLSVRAYREVFGPSKNIYHPHEAAADLFAKLVIYDAYRSKWMSASQRAAREKTFAPLREWFRRNLAKAKIASGGRGVPYMGQISTITSANQPSAVRSTFRPCQVTALISTSSWCRAGSTGSPRAVPCSPASLTATVKSDNRSLRTWNA